MVLLLGGLILFILLVFICSHGYKSPRLEKERQIKELQNIRTGNKLIDRIAKYVNPTKLKRYYTICRNHKDITVQQMYNILADNNIDVQYELYDWFVSNGICEPDDYIEHCYKQSLNWKHATGNSPWNDDGYYTLQKKINIHNDFNMHWENMNDLFKEPYKQKKCIYCGTVINKQTSRCPSCGSTEFEKYEK